MTDRTVILGVDSKIIEGLTKLSEGGETPCRTTPDAAIPVLSTDGAATGHPVPNVRSNAPVDVQSVDQGQALIDAELANEDYRKSIDNLSKLSDEELNVRLAELRGYTFHDVKLHKGEAVYEKFWLRPGVKLEDITADDICWREGTSAPHYTTDLNAVAAVEAGLTENQQGEFINALCTICEPDRSKPGTAMFKAFFATARQHTVALIATLTHHE